MKISQIALFAIALQQTCAVVVEHHQVSKVKPPEDIKTVIHKKKPSAGYQKGSPLFNKQEGITGKDKQAVKQTDATIIYDDAHPQHGAHKQFDFYTTLASVSVYAVFVLAAAYIFKTRMQPPIGARAKGESPKNHPAWIRCGFAYSFLDFSNLSSDWQICLLSLCCPVLQWARTASSSATPFMSYWKAIAFMLSMVVLAPFTYGLTGVVIMAVFLKRRRDLRKAYNHNHPGGENRSMLEDVLLIFCCPSLQCCQLVQEAREVEYTTAQAKQDPA